MTDINGISCFLSHSSFDKNFARKLAGDLESQGITVWIDEKTIEYGKSITNSVSDGIRNSDIFLLVISKNSSGSEWVQKELEEAHKLKNKDPKSIIPIIIDDSEVPDLLKDLKYLKIVDSNSYQSSIKDLYDFIVFDDSFYSRYKNAYSGGIAVDKVIVTGNVLGKKNELVKFKEFYTVRIVKPIEGFYKEMNVDGRIGNVIMEGGVIERKKRSKSIETWFVKPSGIERAGSPISFILEYELIDCFDDKFWDYSIDAPTKKFVFEMIFNQENCPSRFDIHLKETQTILKKFSINPIEKHGSFHFRFEQDFPVYKNKFEFDWN